MENIFKEIRQERQRQNLKWGEQNHPVLDPVLINRGADRMCQEFEIPTEARAKQLCDLNAFRGTCTWMHILVEEISEVASCQSPDDLREELIQAASVIVATIESLDRNGR